MRESHVVILECSASPHTGKRAELTRTDGLKAVIAIYEMLTKKSTSNAITTALTFEMVAGPLVDESSSSVQLG